MSLPDSYLASKCTNKYDEFQTCFLAIHSRKLGIVFSKFLWPASFFARLLIALLLFYLLCFEWLYTNRLPVRDNHQMPLSVRLTNLGIRFVALEFLFKSRRVNRFSDFGGSHEQKLGGRLTCSPGTNQNENITVSSVARVFFISSWYKDIHQPVD